MKNIFFIILLSPILIYSAEIYPDQNYSFEVSQNITRYATEAKNVIENSDSSGLMLKDKTLDGYIIFKKTTSTFPFNEVLPSWNGYAPENQKSSFKIQMRFYQLLEWSPWVTVGYWKNNIWEDYGATNWADGKVNIDTVNLETYTNMWQFKVIMKRESNTDTSPIINRLTFFLSDSETTDNFNVKEVLKDNPKPIFNDTIFINQYNVDKSIGSSICSPTVVAMVLGSYNNLVDPLAFAQDNLDPYWGIFGVWPRTVQNAAQHGLKGAVTRYRSWSDVREVIRNNGRVCITVGKPLYAGHLMMIAGFDNSGNPIVHDPAKKDGYSYTFNKETLSKSWFKKGGIAYTFYEEDSL